MKQINYKKLIIPNIPYVFFVYLFDKVGQATRLAPGADISERYSISHRDFPKRFKCLAERSPVGFAYRHCRRGGYSSDCLCQREKRKEIPQGRRIRQRTLECIILSVKNSTWTHRRICT